MRQRDAARIAAWVLRAQAGDREAFDLLVGAFQDAAVGYALSLLGDVHLAEDAAVEAFVEAWRDLADLRSPAAFPAWLRRIVFKQCDRLTRGRRPPSVPLEAAAAVPSTQDDPARAVLRQADTRTIRQALTALPEPQRAVVMLFHLGGYSHRDTSLFLGVPISTVKSRLHAARARLKEVLQAMGSDLSTARPSRDAHFLDRVMALVARAEAEMAAGDRNEAAIRAGHPLARYRDPHPVFDLSGALLRWAIEEGVEEVGLVPRGGGLRVQFASGVRQRTVAILPASVQTALVERLKDCAAMDVTRTDIPQQGEFPAVRREDPGRVHIVCVASAPHRGGEKVVLTIASRAAMPASAGGPAPGPEGPDGET